MPSGCVVYTHFFQSKVTGGHSHAAISVEPEVISGLVSTVRALPDTLDMIQEATAADSILQ